MSGHSKWSQIKHKKAKEDSKRGKAFTKLIKEITITARLGGGDPAGNPRLRLLIEKAKEINMPADNIQRGIKKGTGEIPGGMIEEITYEGYGPNGIAVIVDCMADNKNRMAAEMRRMFSNAGGNLGENGSVSWMFEKMGVIKAEGSGFTEDELLEKLIDYDISALEVGEGWYSVQCDPKSLDKVKQAVAGLGLKIDTAQIEWVPKTSMSLPTDKAEKAYEFLTSLDDNEDVKSVYTNLA